MSGIHVAGLAQEGGLAGFELRPREHLDARQVMVPVLDEGDPQQDGQAPDHHARRLADHRLVPWRDAAWWHSKAPSILPRPIALIFWRPLPEGGAREVGVGLHAVDEDDRVGVERVPCREHAEAMVGPRQLRGLDVRHDGRAHGGLGDAEGLEHLHLAGRGAAAMARRIAGITKGRAPADRRAATTPATTSA